MSVSSCSFIGFQPTVFNLTACFLEAGCGFLPPPCVQANLALLFWLPCPPLLLSHPAFP
jgi:hypothetical protein